MTRPQGPEDAIEPEAPANGRPPEAVPIRDRLLWSLDDIASLCGVSKRFLEMDRAAGRMPAPDVRLGRRIMWRPATVNRWLDAKNGDGRR